MVETLTTPSPFDSEGYLQETENSQKPDGIGSTPGRLLALRPPWIVSQAP